MTPLNNPPPTKKYTVKDLSELVFETFHGRRDVVPEYFHSKKTGKKGYSPICTNRFEKGCNLKKRGGRCKDCEIVDYKPQSPELLTKHIAGKTLLGVYPMVEDDKCSFIACDLDDHSGDKSPYTDMRELVAVLDMWSLDNYVFRSKSGKGYHIYIFFDAPVEARKARLVYFAALEEAQVIDPDKTKITSFDRLIPNQDKASNKYFGNLIALPYYGKAFKAGHTLILSPESEYQDPYPTQGDILKKLKKVSELHLDAIIEEYNLNVVKDIKKPSGEHRESEHGPILERCAFIKHCRDDAHTLPEPHWYAMLSIIARCKDGRKIAHDLSKDYHHYTPEETDEKLDKALSDTGPFTCKYISDEIVKGVFCHGCTERVKSPIVLGLPKGDSYLPKDAEAALLEMNKEFAAVMLSGKFRIMRETHDPAFDRHVIEFVQKGDFLNYYADTLVEVPTGKDKMERKGIGHVWFNWESRRKYRMVVFDPACKINGDVFNLYRGFNCQPAPGEWTLMRDHILNIICSSNVNYCHYLLAWLARMLQRPGEGKPGVAVVLKGDRGTGKGTFVEPFNKILGTHFLHLHDSQRVTGRFNAHFANVLLLFADEAFYAGDKASEGALKGLVTEDALPVEMKGVDSFSVRNYINLVMASNNDWVVPVGMSERRFFILQVSNDKKQDHSYFGAIKKQMCNGGTEAMMHDLLRMDISGVNLRNAPETAALIEQMLYSMSNVEKFWFEILTRGYIIEDPADLESKDESFNVEPIYEWEKDVNIKLLHNQYEEYCHNLKERYISPTTTFGKKLREMCSFDTKRRSDGKRLQYYEFPHLEKCRELFCTYSGKKIDWESIS